MRDRQIMKNRKDYYGIKWAEWYLLVFDSVFTVKVFFNSGTYFFSWHRHMLVNVRWSQAFQFILMQFFFKKHDLDPPQISYINFPAFDWSLWCSSWFATVSQSALKKKLCFWLLNSSSGLHLDLGDSCIKFGLPVITANKFLCMPI